MPTHPFDALIERFAEVLAERLNVHVGRSAKTARAGAAPKRKRNMSAEGIERIRAAAKKRWAKYRKEQRGAK